MNETMKAIIELDALVERMDSRIDDLAREIVSLASKETQGSKWSRGRIDRQLKNWSGTISQSKAPYQVLDFLKRRFAGSSNFWMRRCSNGSMLSEQILSLLQEEGKDEDFDMRLKKYKKIWDCLSLKIFGYIQFS